MIEMTCPNKKCGAMGTRTVRTIPGSTVSREHHCPVCGTRWWSDATVRAGTVRIADGAISSSPVSGGQHPGSPPASGGHPPGIGGGVGGGLPSGSGSDPDPGSHGDPERARSESRADQPITGYELTRLFGVVRVRVLGGGIEWTASPRVTRGAAVDMAEEINATGARHDVEPTMELLLRKAQRGRAGERSPEIVTSPSFAFGAWMSKWTELREELRGRAPAKLAARSGYGKL